MKWLPKNVWFSQESAFPKVNQDEDNRQFITCAAEMWVLVWDFLKPDAGESAMGGAIPGAEDEPVVVKKKIGAWNKFKSKSTLAPLGKGGKWNPATGKYCFLNKIWVGIIPIQRWLNLRKFFSLAQISKNGCQITTPITIHLKRRYSGL